MIDFTDYQGNPLSAEILNKMQEDIYNEINKMQEDIYDEINKTKNKKEVLILESSIKTSSSFIETEIIDLTLYDKIIIQLGNPVEGDSCILEIDDEGNPINNIVHLDDYVVDEYQCKAFAYIKDSKISIITRQLAGWGDLPVKIKGITR
jgi:hypothetical protein